MFELLRRTCGPSDAIEQEFDGFCRNIIGVGRRQRHDRLAELTLLPQAALLEPAYVGMVFRIPGDVSRHAELAAEAAVDCTLGLMRYQVRSLPQFRRRATLSYSI